MRSHRYLINNGICPDCGQDIRNEAKLHDAMRDNYRLREMLKDAWLLGSTHQQPSFDQLNQWHAKLNEK